MKLFSLARAMFSDGMDFFAYRTNSTDSKLKRLLFPVLLAIIVMTSVAYLTDFVIAPLLVNGQVEVIPAFLILLLSLVGLLEGIYKVQSLLFECRDNDILFSLPIRRSQIFALRVAKLLLFQFVYNALLMLPAFAVYAFRVRPGADFYLVSVLMFFLVPLIPTAIAVAIGYIVKFLALGFHHEKISQTILTFVALMAMLLIIGNWQSITLVFSSHLATIADWVGRFYYPIGAYLRLLSGFSWPDFLGLIASCVLPLVAIIYLCSLGYFKVISKTSVTPISHTKSAKIQVKSSSRTRALVRKELNRVTASPVFMVNTLFGPVLLLFCTIMAGVSLDGLIGFFSSGGEEVPFTAEDIALIAPLFYLGALIVMGTMTSITSSMISLEGKSFNLTRSLPVSSRQILFAKLLASLVLALPLFLLSGFCFIVEFRPPLEYALLSLLFPFLILVFSGVVGLLINLKYPKLGTASDAEIVKQSASSLSAVFIGMGAGIVSVAFLVVFPIFTGLDSPIFLALIYLIIDLGLLKILSTSGARKFHQIEV